MINQMTAFWLFIEVGSFWPLFKKTQLDIWPDIRPFLITGHQAGYPKSGAGIMPYARKKKKSDIPYANTDLDLQNNADPTCYGSTTLKKVILQ